jgi:23S rRNA pseudouridine2605 synthase
VQIGSVANKELVKKLCDGIVERSENLRATRASVLRTSQKTSWLEITLDEGRNRQIRRMLAADGIEVLRLIRIAIGPLVLGDLAKGTVRSLSTAEKRSLDLR